MSECRRNSEPRLVRARELFADHDRVAKITTREPPHCFLDPRTQQTLLTGRAPRRSIDAALGAPLLLFRHDLALDELAHGLSVDFVFLVEELALHLRTSARQCTPRAWRHTTDPAAAFTRRASVLDVWEIDPHATDQRVRSQPAQRRRDRQGRRIIVEPKRRQSYRARADLRGSWASTSTSTRAR